MTLHTPVRIVAAAIQRNGLIYFAPPPARHHTVMKLVDDNHGQGHEIFLPTEQGFVGSDGLYYGREEAGRIALAAGQTEALKWGNQLYSEDLW